MGKTCEPKAFSFQCMTEFTRNKKKKRKKIKKGEMAEKEVHGGVKFRIDCDDHNHTQVPQHRDCIDGKEDQEEGHLDLWVF